MQVRVWLCGDDRDDFKQFGPEVPLKALSLTEVIFFCENSLSFTFFFFLVCLLSPLLIGVVNKLYTGFRFSSPCHHQWDTKAVDKKVNTGAGSRAGTWQCVSSIPAAWDQDVSRQPFQHRNAKDGPPLARGYQEGALSPSAKGTPR